jgi:hypothetical protein
MRKYITRIYHAIINKKIIRETSREIPTTIVAKELTADEIWDLYKREKDKRTDSIKRGSGRPSPLEVKLFGDWFYAKSPRMLKIINDLNYNDKKIVINAKNKELLMKIVDNDESNKILAKYLEDNKNKSKETRLMEEIYPDTVKNNKYGYFLQWFNLNRELLIEVMTSTNSLPENIIYKAILNKPNDDLQRLIAREKYVSRTALDDQWYEEDKKLHEKNKK